MPPMQIHNVLNPPERLFLPPIYFNASPLLPIRCLYTRTTFSYLDKISKVSTHSIVRNKSNIFHAEKCMLKTYNVFGISLRSNM